MLVGLRTAALLALSNTFMTAAWYGHLRYRTSPLWAAILASWGLAFFEYCLQVPANRWGYGTMTAYQLKILQEAVSLLVFVVFAAWWLGEGLSIRYAVSMLLVGAAVVVATYGS